MNTIKPTLDILELLKDQRYIDDELAGEELKELMLEIKVLGEKIFQAGGMEGLHNSHKYISVNCQVPATGRFVDLCFNGIGGWMG